MNYKSVSITADIIGVVTLAIIFFANYKTDCFKVSEWYFSLSPILVSYITQFLTLFVEKQRGE